MSVKNGLCSDGLTDGRVQRASLTSPSLADTTSPSTMTMTLSLALSLGEMTLALVQVEEARFVNRDQGLNSLAVQQEGNGSTNCRAKIIVDQLDGVIL